MTLAELESYPNDMLTAAEVAPILGADPHSIRLQARANPAALGFPVIIIGKRVLIPRQGLLRFCKGEAVREKA